MVFKEKEQITQMNKGQVQNGDSLRIIAW
jgi:hypothetical protein